MKPYFVFGNHFNNQTFEQKSTVPEKRGQIFLFFRDYVKDLIFGRRLTVFEEQRVFLAINFLSRQWLNRFVYTWVKNYSLHPVFA